MSIISLIANPKEYDKKKVIVRGYYHTSFEENALYLSKDDCAHGISSNGLWLEFDPALDTSFGIDKWNNEFIFVVGTFDAYEKGHMDVFNGSIRNIEIIKAGHPR